MSDWFLKKINWLAGGVAVAFLFGLAALLSNIEIKDLDLWLHLAAGQYITAIGGVPQTDFFSATIAGASWINHEWMFQVLVHAVYANAGIDGLIGLKAAVVLVTFVVLLLLGYRGEYKAVPVAVLFLVLLVYQIRLTLRPDIVSLLIFILFVTILKYALGRRWSLWGLTALQIVWTNVHGFFIFGPVLVLFWLFGECLKRRAALPFAWNNTGRLTDGEYRRLKFMAFAVVAACLVNPSFLKGALYPLSVLLSLGGDSKIFFSQIQELQPTLQWSALFVWDDYGPYKALIVLSAASFYLNRRRIDVTVLAVWALFLVFSLCALRNIVFFAMAAYWAFISNWSGTAEQAPWPVVGTRRGGKTAAHVLLTALIVMWTVPFAGRQMLRGYYDFDRYERKSEFGGLSLRNYPYRAADFLVANGIRGRFFNDFNSGAYLLGRTFPGIKVFIDGRTEVYGPAFYETYRKILHGDKDLFDEAVARYGLTGVFLGYVYVPSPAKTMKHLSESDEWVPVYFDYDAVVFLKDIPANRPWIDRLRVDLARRPVPPADLLKIGTVKAEPYRYINRAWALYNLGFSAPAEREAVEALRIEPYNAKAHKLLGKIANERGDYAAAFELLRKAKLVEPDDMKVAYEIAYALDHLGRRGEAAKQCRKVLAADAQHEGCLEIIKAAGGGS